MTLSPPRDTLEGGVAGACLPRDSASRGPGPLHFLSGRGPVPFPDGTCAVPFTWARRSRYRLCHFLKAMSLGLGLRALRFHLPEGKGGCARRRWNPGSLCRRSPSGPSLFLFPSSFLDIRYIRAPWTHTEKICPPFGTGLRLPWCGENWVASPRLAGNGGSPSFSPG